MAVFPGRAGAQGTSLDQAKSIYATVASDGGSDRAPLEMARARSSIDAADSASANGHDQATSDAMATQALHDAQAAQAADSRIHDRQVTDSLHAYRLTQLVALSQRQRDELFRQNQLSHAEIVDLRAQSLLTVTQSDSLRLQLDSVKAAAASAQELSARQLDSSRVMQAQVVRQQDSLRIAQAAANEVRSSSSRQTDSLRAVADRAQRQVDSMRYASQQASRDFTEAERIHSDSLQRAARMARQESDSLQRAARMATQESDSLRRLVGRSASFRDSLRVRDSVRAVSDLSSRTADSIRITQTVLQQAQALAKLRTDSIQRSAALAAQIADSMRAASVRQSLRETVAERQRSDSLRRMSEVANVRLDSLRRSAAQTQRQRDSVQMLAASSAKQVDSLRSEAASASRTRDSLRADVEERTKLSASVSELSRTAGTLRTPTLSPRGLVMTIADASFVNGTTTAGPKTLTKIARRDLGKLTPVVAGYSSYHIIVEGYSDSTARLEKGEALADARAQAVRDALVAGGLDAGRVETRALGHVQPVASNATIAGRKANRRVEIVVVGSAPP